MELKLARHVMEEVGRTPEMLIPWCRELVLSAGWNLYIFLFRIHLCYVQIDERYEANPFSFQLIKW
jgi:hypothetical protein